MLGYDCEKNSSQDLVFLMPTVSFIKVVINAFDMLVSSAFSVLEACKYAGFLIPRFCFHELLSVAGNCRMCLVEVVNSPKPIASCVTPLISNMQILLDTPLVLKARENILEALLLNHPLDCPICDQAGECDLQDQAEKFGSDKSRYSFMKRGVERKNFNPLISTIMTRCIHCTRCIRFSSEILGSEVLGLLSRGQTTEVGNYTMKNLVSELTGNIVDLCPVGALTSKPYSFKARPWELRCVESIDLTDSFGSNVYINFKDVSIFRIIPKANKDLNGTLLTDVARYFFDSLHSQRLFSVYHRATQQGKPVFIPAALPDLYEKESELLFLIDDTLDVEVMNLLQVLDYKSCSSVQVRSINSPSFETNRFYSRFQNNSSVIESSKLIFLLSSNLKAESAVLNSKIRIKFIKEDVQIYKFGSQFSSNFLAPCINLSLNFFFKVIEGKFKHVSSLLVSGVSPLFIIGDALIKRGVQITVFEQVLQKICPLAKCLALVLGCNSVGLIFSNILGFSNKDLIMSEKLHLINVKETIQLFNSLKDYQKFGWDGRKILCGFNPCKKLNWWNTHGPQQFIKFSQRLVPLLPAFYERGLYLNFEQRGQIHNQIFNDFDISKTRSAFSFKKQVLKFLDNENIPFDFLNFYFCIVQKTTLFSFENRFSFSLPNAHSKVSALPTKLSVEDSFLFSRLAKYSTSLAECSSALRESSTNFINALKNKVV